MCDSSPRRNTHYTETPQHLSFSPFFFFLFFFFCSPFFHIQTLWVFPQAACFSLAFIFPPDVTIAPLGSGEQRIAHAHSMNRKFPCCTCAVVRDADHFRPSASLIHPACSESCDFSFFLSFFPFLSFFFFWCSGSVKCCNLFQSRLLHFCQWHYSDRYERSCFKFNGVRTKRNGGECKQHEVL